ncbi:lipoprotein-releasing system transmembrane subunit LolC, partial [Pelagibacterales bacterium SAG-MED09]|nr:lipoprotein-releasing system transmembrane subunit LolC [Pelagibacterales bacterium SAG-MED09]
MSVMNGFRTELINKIVGFNAHITVKSYDKSEKYDSLKNKDLEQISKSLILSNSSEGIIIREQNSKGILLRGYLEGDFSKLDLINNKNFIGKDKKIRKNFVSIGKELSFILDLEIGDNITIMSSSGVETIIGNLPKQKTFTVASIFESGVIDFDENIVFLNLATLEEFSNLSENDRNLEIYLKKPQDIENQKKIVKNIFPEDLVFSWADMNKSLFSALKVERNVMFIILSLIIIVAAFNIISGLTILVKNKTKDIAILKSIGVLNNSIIKIFFLVGIIIGTSATFFGILIGITFSYYVENIREFISSAFDLTLFPEEIYFLSTMPSEINASSIILISICSICIT